MMISLMSLNTHSLAFSSFIDKGTQCALCKYLYKFIENQIGGANDVYASTTNGIQSMYCEEFVCVFCYF